MRTSGVRRSALGVLAALAAGAVLVVGAPSASAESMPTPPVPVVTELAPGAEGYVALPYERENSICIRTCWMEHYFRAPEGVTFVDAPVHVVDSDEPDRWYEMVPRISDGGRTLEQSWAPDREVSRPSGFAVVKVRIADDVVEGTAFPIYDDVLYCREYDKVCTSSQLTLSATITVSPLGVPAADALVAVPVLVVLAGVGAGLVGLRRRRVAAAV